MNQLSFLQPFTNAGGDWVIYLLIAASVLSIAVMIERFVLVLRQRSFVNRWQDEMAGWGRLPAAQAQERVRALAAVEVSSTARMVSDLVSTSEGSVLTPEQQLDMRLVLEKRFLDRRLLVLGTLGNNAPFVGLLGTVLGVIRAFHDLASSAGGPEVVMEGLSDALVATAVGILVAIPCVAAYNVLQKMIRDLISDMDHVGKRIIAIARRSSK